VAASAVLVRVWKPARPETMGPAIRPAATPMAMGFHSAHFAAALCSRVAGLVADPVSGCPLKA
jgi:hypothetical protein